MDALLGRKVGLLVHVETTPAPPRGSPVRSPTLTEANHNDMFSNRIGFGPRLGAALLDLVFIIVLTVPFMFLGGVSAALVSMLGLDAMFSSEDAEALALVGAGTGLLASGAVAVLVGTAYTLIEAFTGASPGKRAMGLKVAHADGTQGNVQLYLLRWALKNSGSLLIFLPAIANLARLVFFFGCFATLGDKRQALHDMIAKSAVYKKADIAA